MPKAFSFASWNVEHFGNKRSRADRCVEFLKTSANAPDVFAIFEVTSREVFSQFTAALPSHNFFVTEGLQSQETLVGVHKSLTAFVTQRQEFKSKIPTLRPGTLVTLDISGTLYSLLFLHVKSLPDPVGWGLRDDMMEHARNLKKALNKHAKKMTGQPANFLIAGDLNTMGLNVKFGDNDTSGAEEIKRLGKRFKSAKMTLMAKDQASTWWGGGSFPPSDLDHVLASQQLDVRDLAGEVGISVLGWPQESTETEQRRWIRDFSDHALIYGEVWA